MELRHIVDVVHAVLRGKDYRKYVLALINERFLKEIANLLKEAYKYKIKYGEDWISVLLKDLKNRSGKYAKNQLLWFSGFNEKTIKNMIGTTKKDRILELGILNVDGIRIIAQGLLEEENIIPTLIIREKDKSEDAEFTPEETFYLLNAISTARLTIQGGAWSEVGIQAEKVLLCSLFNLCGIPQKYYELDSAKILSTIEEKISDSDVLRDIDGLLYTEDGEILTIEVKLLGIGNPEIGDEALARGVSLFITDQLTGKMKTIANNRGITTLVLRDLGLENTIIKFTDFLKRNGVPFEESVRNIISIIKDEDLKWIICDCASELNGTL
jgi:hypothetical protein